MREPENIVNPIVWKSREEVESGRVPENFEIPERIGFLEKVENPATVLYNAV